MHIRARFPFSCYVSGPDAASLSPEFRFTLRGCVVTANFQGDGPLSLDTLPENERWFRRVRYLTVTVDEGATERVAPVVAANNPEPIVGVLLKPVNRVINALRNFGLVTHVRQFRPDEFHGDDGLDHLDVETSLNGRDWTRLRPLPDNIEGMLARSMRERDPIGNFEVANVELVREAIEDDLPPGPERVFLANAMESARVGDLRVAVLEIVICLEIVVGQLLTPLLANASVAPDALTKEVTLFHRIKLLLPLLLPHVVAEIDMAAVLRTVTRRNKIVHQSGHLPDGIPEADVRAGISAVAWLVHLLARERDALQLKPKLKSLSEEIATRFSVRPPTINTGLRHHFTVHFGFMLDPVPPIAQLEQIARAVLEGLQVIDPRCKVESEAFVFFTHMGTDIASWQDGRFVEFPPSSARP